MPKSYKMIAVTILGTLSLFGVTGIAAADPLHRSGNGRCDVAIVDDHGRVIRIDEKSQGTRIDGLRCDDGLWRFTTDGNTYRRGDVAAATLVRER
jgi:hypothetical protein